MILTEKHIQILKDIHMFSRIKRYHGMLPQKDAVIYDENAMDYLMDEGLVEEGCIFTTCGNNPKGYRLSDTARDDLKELGVSLSGQEFENLEEADFIATDHLTKDHLDVLMDIQHLTQINKFHGIAPRHVMDEYDKALLKDLYDSGYVFHIKLKGKKVKYEKGLVLSDKAQRMLQQLERG